MRLVNVLSDTYPDRRDILRILRAAGVEIAQVELADKPLNAWSSGLHQAELQERLVALIEFLTTTERKAQAAEFVEAALEEFPKHEALRRYIAQRSAPHPETSNFDKLKGMTISLPPSGPISEELTSAPTKRGSLFADRPQKLKIALSAALVLVSTLAIWRREVLASVYQVGCRNLGRTAACDGAAKLLAELQPVSFNDQEFIRLLDLGCLNGRGLPKSCARLGHAYLTGKQGVKQDYDRAQQFAKFACDRDDPDGCINLGLLYEQGLGGLPKSASKAVHLYSSKGCTPETPIGCRNAGLIYARGADGVVPDLGIAEERFKTACQWGDDLGCEHLGALYEVKKSFSLAKDSFRPVCDKGSGRACNHLATLLREHPDGAREYEESLELNRLACKYSEVNGCFEVGRRSKSIEERRRMFALACDKGHGPGCTNAGFSWDKNSGDSADYVKAVDFYLRGYRLKQGLSCYNLGAAFLDGRGVEQDIDSARFFYKRACDYDVKEACHRLELPPFTL